MSSTEIFPYSIARDENGKILELFHGTDADFDKFDRKQTVDGAFHFGTIEQATMRCAGAPKKILINVAINIKNPRRSRDTGSGWKSKIQSAKKAGFDGIVYLNRFEGIKVESLAKALENGIDLDKLSDEDFKKVIPEARDSWIVFEPFQIKILGRHIEEKSNVAKEEESYRDSKRLSL